MKLLQNVLCFLFIINICHAQKVKTDSLQNAFENTKLQDSVRFEAGYDYYLSQTRISLDSARVTGFKLLNLAKTKQNKSWQSTSNNIIGTTYAIQGQFEKAQDYFFKSHNILLELNDKKGLATSNNNIGTIFYELGNFTTAQDYLFESLKLSEELKDDNNLSRALNNLGNVYYDLNEYDKALNYYNRSLKIKEKLGKKSRLPSAYNNIGLIYSKLKKHDLAIETLTKSVSIAEEIGDEISVSRALSNIGIEYSYKGNYSKAISFFDKSLVNKIQNDSDVLASAYLNRGRNYLSLKQYNKGKSDCLSSLKISENSGALNLQKEACECIGDASEFLGDYKLALDYNHKYIKLKDSLFNKKKTQEITRNEMNYQFEKKQLADSVAFHKRETAQKVAFQKDLNKQHRKFYITLILSLLVIGFLLFMYAKHKQNLKLKSLENNLLNSEIEYKKKDLTNLAVNISNNQEWAESLAEKLKTLKASTGRKRINELESLETEIKNKIWVNKGSDDFYKQIDELSSSFYEKLTSQYEGLTKTDIRLCSLIKLNLNTKQIATLQNINPSSVKMSRNRLRKKLNLIPEDDLNTFLRTF